MLDASGTDWTGKMLGNSPNYSRPVPLVTRKSKLYGLILIEIRQLEISLKPAHPKELLILLSKLRLHFAHSEISRESAQLMFEDYLTDLVEYPKDIIEKVCTEFRTECDEKFFPRISQIKKAMDKLLYPRKWRLTKLKTLLEISNFAEEEIIGKK